MLGRKKSEEKKVEKSYVKACPSCSSRNLVMEPGISIFTLFGYVYQYRCRDCGYFGPNFDLQLEDAQTGENLDAKPKANDQG